MFLFLRRDLDHGYTVEVQPAFVEMRSILSRSMPPEAIRPQPLVTGDDLIAAGYEPGPRFKEILGAIEDAQLEGRVATHEAAMEMVRLEFPR
jgi:hypothetical protein